MSTFGFDGLNPSIDTLTLSKKIFNDHLELHNPTEFSFDDIFASIILPFTSPRDSSSPVVELPGLSLISVSEHKDTYPVTNFGNDEIQGYTVGKTLVAGSLGFTVFNENPW